MKLNLVRPPACCSPDKKREHELVETLERLPHHILDKAVWHLINIEIRSQQSAHAHAPELVRVEGSRRRCISTATKSGVDNQPIVFRIKSSRPYFNIDSLIRSLRKDLRLS